VTLADGAKLICTGNPANTLDGVSLTGDLDVTASLAQVLIRNGLTLTGSVLLANGGTMTIVGSQTLDTGSIVFTDIFGYVVLASNTTLTLGPDMVVRGKSGNVNGAGKLINQGLISAEVAGGTITINPSQFENTGTIQSKNGGSLAISGATWSSTGLIDAAGGGTLALGGAWNNLGTINANGVTLNLGGVFGLPQLGIFHRTGGTVNLAGTLNLSGDTLALNATTGSWALNGGTIHSGHVNFTGGATLQFLNSGLVGTLEGATLDSDLTIPDGVTVGVLGGLTVNAVLTLASTNSSSRLLFGLLNPEPQTLGGTGQLVFGGSGGQDMLDVRAPLTFEAGFTVHGASGLIDASQQPLTNNGRIAADVAGGVITIRGTPFTNNGITQELNGGKILINP
jgi:hypothetical protein